MSAHRWNLLSKITDLKKREELADELGVAPAAIWAEIMGGDRLSYDQKVKLEKEWLERP